MCLSVYVLPCLSLQCRIGQGISVYFHRLLFLSPPDKTAIWPQSKTTSPDILDHRRKCVIRTFCPLVLTFINIWSAHLPYAGWFSCSIPPLWEWPSWGHDPSWPAAYPGWHMRRREPYTESPGTLHTERDASVKDWLRTDGCSYDEVGADEAPMGWLWVIRPVSMLTSTRLSSRSGCQ